MRKWLKRGALALLGVAVLAVVVWVGCFYYLEHALRQEIAQLRMDKILLTYDELVPPVPDAENAVPVLRELVGTIVPPPDDLTIPGSTAQDINSEEMERLSDWTRKNTHVFSGMKEVIARPRYRMEYPLLLRDIHQDTDSKIPLGNLFKLYKTKIYLLFKNKKISNAADHIIDFLRFCSLYEKSCTSHTEYAITLIFSGMTYGYIDAIISKYEISESQLNEIASLLDSLDIPRLIKQAIQGELIFEYTLALSPIDEHLSILFSPKTIEVLYFYYRDDIFTDAPKYIEIATSPPYSTKDSVDFLEKKHQHDLIPGHYTQAFPKHVFYPVINVISRLDILRLKLALLRHLAKHKRLPETLQAIDTSILPVVPRDAYTGSDYVYTAEGVDSFTVTSEAYEQNWPEPYRVQTTYKKPATAHLPD